MWLYDISHYNRHVLVSLRLTSNLITCMPYYLFGYRLQIVIVTHFVRILFFVSSQFYRLMTEKSPQLLGAVLAGSVSPLEKESTGRYQ